MKNYLSLIKFSHTVFALPFALVGFTIAATTRPAGDIWLKLFLVLICMVMARSAAMAFNRYLDRDIDAANERTASREIPSGVISPQRALLFVSLNCAGFVLPQLSSIRCVSGFHRLRCWWYWATAIPNALPGFVTQCWASASRLRLWARTLR